MWENRCKVAVSCVRFSKVTRSAEIPLAAHALQAVKGAVEDSGLDMKDIDGLATYPELPATGHAVIDGVTIVSVNCMMAMLKLPNLTWHVQVETVNIGGAVQQAVNALLAGVCRYAVVWRAMHNPKGTYQNLPGTYAQGPAQFTIWLSPYLFTPLLFVLGVSFACGMASTFKYIGNDFPDNMGVVSGIVGMAGGIGGFLLPIMFVALLDLLGVPSTCFMLMYGIVWVSLILNYLTEVRRAPVMGEGSEAVAQMKEATVGD